jgi:hypothetical protein
MTRTANMGIGADWTEGVQEGLINNRGETIIHEIGVRCTCNFEDTYAGQIENGAHVARKRHQLGCSICGGEGYLYRKPTKIVALITGIRGTKNQMESGWAYPGDATMSVKPDYVTVSAGDLVTFTWPQPLPDGQVILRGAAHLNDNDLRKTLLEENEDRLWYNAHSSIYCEDEDGNEYFSGSDFELNTSKIIKWLGNSPKVGKTYVIKYNAYLEWIVFMPPDVRRDRDRDLGGRCLIRKRHVANVNNQNIGIRASDKVLFCERIRGCQ